MLIKGRSRQKLTVWAGKDPQLVALLILIQTNGTHVIRITYQELRKRLFNQYIYYISIFNRRACDFHTCITSDKHAAFSFTFWVLWIKLNKSRNSSCPPSNSSGFFRFLSTNEGAAALKLSVYISSKRTQTATAACDRIWRSSYLSLQTQRLVEELTETAGLDVTNTLFTAETTQLCQWPCGEFFMCS